jgi:hypothetical protein
MSDDWDISPDFDPDDFSIDDAEDITDDGESVVDE